MTNFTRKFLEEFAKDNKNTELTIFGSTGAGSPTDSADPEVLQSNSKFKEGWKGGTILNAGNLTRNPVQNEMSALAYIANYQLNHILQKGLQEYNTLTEYFIGDKVNSGTKIYQSLTNNNSGNAVTDEVNWKLLTNLDVNIIVINSESDFPDAVASVITLESGKHYLINAQITTANRFVFPAGDVQISSTTIFNTLVYTGGGVMFTGNAGLVITDQMIFVAPGGTFFDFDDALQFFSFDTIWTTCDNIGNVNCDNFSCVFSTFNTFGGGIVSADRTDTNFRTQLIMLDTGMVLGTNNTTTFLDISGNLQDLVIRGGTMRGGSNETILNLQQSLKDNSTNISFQNCVLQSDLAIFASDSLEQDYIFANFSGNIGVADSSVTLKLDFLSSTLSTTINTVNVPEPINARWTCGLQERMQFQDRATFVASTDIITAVLEDGITVFTHNFSTDDIVQFFPGSGGTLPTGIVEGQEYFIITDTASTYQISETAGGGVFDFTTNGSGTIYYRHTAGTNALSWVIYIGNENIKVGVNANFSMKLTGGGTKDMRAIITKSDVVFAETISSRASTVNVTSAKPQGSIANDLVELATGEGIRFEAENLTDATAVDVTASTVIISLT